MKLSKSLFLIIPATLLLNGCLVFHKVSYDLVLKTDRMGTANVTITDIRSDAAGDTEFETDKNNLFSYMLESEEFITEMRKEGKDITGRSLKLNGDTLIGTVTYEFEDVSKVEGLSFDGGFYYLTLSPEDSVLSTNGEVIVSEEHKRIIWDHSIKKLQFTMLSFVFAENEFRALSSYLKL